MARRCSWLCRFTLLCLIACSLHRAGLVKAASETLTGSDSDVSASSSSEGVIDPSAAGTQCNITGMCLACTEEQKVSDPACRGTGFRQAITCVETYSASSSLESSDDKGTDDTSTTTAYKASSLDGGFRSGRPKASDSSDAEGGEGEEAEPEGEQEESRLGVEKSVRRGRRQPRTFRTSTGGTGKRQRGRRLAVGVIGEETAGREEGSGGREEEGAGGSVTADTVIHRESTINTGDMEEGGRVRRFVTFESCKPDVETVTVVAFESVMLVIFAISAPVVYHRKRKWANTMGMTRLPTTSRF